MDSQGIHVNMDYVMLLPVHTAGRDEPCQEHITGAEFPAAPTPASFVPWALASEVVVMTREGSQN